MLSRSITDGSMETQEARELPEPDLDQVRGGSFGQALYQGALLALFACAAQDRCAPDVVYYVNNGR